eukprot:EG_transcript_533
MGDGGDSEDFQVFAAELPIAGTFMGLAVVLSILQIYQHAANYKAPALQRPIIRILFMVPIYAIVSFMSLMFKSKTPYIVVIRDTYEAFVLYQFMTLLVEYCGGERELVRVLNCKRARAHHLTPFCCISFPVDKDFLLLCKRGTLQYCLIKPCTAALGLVLHPFGFYNEGNLDFTAADAYPTFFVVNNTSVGISMYYLVLFGSALEDELKIHKPLMKFFCIKCIIFFSFWQGAALTLLVRLNYLTDRGSISAGHIATALQDFIICCEMLGIAIMHHWSFTYNVLQKEAAQSRYGYLFTQEAPPQPPRQPLKVVTNIGGTLNVADCLSDGRRTLGKSKAGLLEDDDNYSQAFRFSDCKVDPRTRLPIVELDPQKVAHYPAVFRDDRVTFYWLGPVKHGSPTGKPAPGTLAVCDLAVFLLTPAGEPKRCIPLTEIVELIVEADEGRVSFRVPTEYDLQVHPEDRNGVTEITHILTQWFKVFGEGRELKIDFFGDAELRLDTPRDFVLRLVEPPCPTDPRTNLPLATVPEPLRPLFPNYCAEACVLFFFEPVRQVKPGVRTDRILAITDTAVYVLRPTGELRRCIAIGEVDEVLLDPVTSHLALVVPREYDLLVRCRAPEQAGSIVHILREWRRYFCRGASADLRVTTVSAEEQRRLVLRDPEGTRHWVRRTKAVWHMGHKKGKDKSHLHGNHDVEFGVPMDELCKAFPSSEFHWLAGRAANGASGEFDSVGSGGLQSPPTGREADETEAYPQTQTLAHQHSRRCLRDDASEHTSDDGEEETLSDVDEPAVQLGLESLSLSSLPNFNPEDPPGDEPEAAAAVAQDPPNAVSTKGPANPLRPPLLYPVLLNHRSRFASMPHIHPPAVTTQLRRAESPMVRPAQPPLSAVPPLVVRLADLRPPAGEGDRTPEGSPTASLPPGPGPAELQAVAGRAGEAAGESMDNGFTTSEASDAHIVTIPVDEVDPHSTLIGGVQDGETKAQFALDEVVVGLDVSGAHEAGHPPATVPASGPGEGGRPRSGEGGGPAEPALAIEQALPGAGSPAAEWFGAFVESEDGPPDSPAAGWAAGDVDLRQPPHPTEAAPPSFLPLDEPAMVPVVGALTQQQADGTLMRQSDSPSSPQTPLSCLSPDAETALVVQFADLRAPAVETQKPSPEDLAGLWEPGGTGATGEAAADPGAVPPREPTEAVADALSPPVAPQPPASPACDVHLPDALLQEAGPADPSSPTSPCPVIDAAGDPPAAPPTSSLAEGAPLWFPAGDGSAAADPGDATVPDPVRACAAAGASPEVVPGVGHPGAAVEVDVYLPGPSGSLGAEEGVAAGLKEPPLSAPAMALEPLLADQPVPDVGSPSLPPISPHPTPPWRLSPPLPLPTPAEPIPLMQPNGFLGDLLCGGPAEQWQPQPLPNGTVYSPAARAPRPPVDF